MPEESQPIRKRATTGEQAVCWRTRVVPVRCSNKFENHWRKDHEHFGRTKRAGFYVAEPGKERGEAVGFCGEEERRAGVVPARLEPDLHERTRLLCERHEEFRDAGCGSARRECGQRVVAQSVRRKNGYQVFPTSGFSSSRSDEREVWNVSRRQGNHWPSDCHREQGRQSCLVQELRYSRGAGPEGSRRGAIASEGRDGLGKTGAVRVAFWPFFSCFSGSTLCRGEIDER